MYGGRSPGEENLEIKESMNFNAAGLAYKSDLLLYLKRKRPREDMALS